MSQTSAAAPRKPPDAVRSRGVLEVLVIMAAVLGLLWAASAIPLWRAWEQAALGGQWSVQILAFMVLPLVLARAFGHTPASLGVGLGGLRRPLEVGLTALVVAGPASGIAFPMLGMLGWSPYSWQGGGLLAVVYAACVPLTGLVIRKAKPAASIGTNRARLGIAVAVLAVALAVSALTVDQAPIVSRVLLAFLVVGMGEELLFRGVVQTRLDQAFGRPWRILGADLGWGRILASLLFGIAHLLSPAAPWQGGWALWTFVAGLLFGYIRAKGGSFVASGLVHGALLAVAAVFVPA